MPSKENIVKRLNFCIWTEQSTRWLPMDQWDRGAKPVQVRDGATCVGDWILLPLAISPRSASTSLPRMRTECMM